MFRSIAQLEAYYWVARLGSFQAAADRLGVSQPSVSQRIKELEQQVGADIFTRDGRGARLTDQGHIMFDHIDKVMTLLSELSDHFRGGASLKGVLRFGIPDSFAEACLSSFLKILREKYPDLLTSIRVNNSRALIQQFEEGGLDIAVLVRPKISTAYRQIFLGYLTMIWIASPTISLPKGKVDPLYLSRQRIITNPLPSPTHSILMEWFALYKLVPPQVDTCDNLSTIAKVTADGQAISIIPKCIVNRQLAEGSLVEFESEMPLPEVEMYVVYPKRALNRGMREIVDVIRESVKGSGFIEE